MKTYTGEPYLLLSETELETVSDFVRDLVRDASLYNKPTKITFSDAQRQIAAMRSESWDLPYGIDADLLRHFWNQYAASYSD